MIEEEGSADAIALLSRDDLAAPTLLHAEVANTIWKKARRGEFAPDPGLVSLPEQIAEIIETHDETPVMARALAIAMELDHPVYDCVYLALAEALETSLVTADERFLRKLDQRYAGAKVMALGA
nr:type II toxin-antitoxin system VapC family toxin [Sphingomonas vulcanisoli]